MFFKKIDNKIYITKCFYVNKITMLKYLVWLLYVLNIRATDITITQFPSSQVLRGRSQTISWIVPDGVILQTSKVDIYQNSQFAQTLGLINNQAKSFIWSVSPSARTGRGYAIRVTGTSTAGKTAWATTPSFSIVSNMSTSSNGVGIGAIVGISLAVIVLLIMCGCKRRNYRNGHTGVYLEEGRANYHTMAQGIPVANPTIIRRPTSGYSGSSMAGAALAGVAGGVVLDEVLSSRRHSWYGGNDYGGNDYGGNDYGGGTFGDGGDFGGGGDNYADSGGGF